MLYGEWRGQALCASPQLLSGLNDETLIPICSPVLSTGKAHVFLLGAPIRAADNLTKGEGQDTLGSIVGHNKSKEPCALWFGPRKKRRVKGTCSLKEHFTLQTGGNS